MSFLRKLTVFLCLAVVLLTAISPSATGMLSACLITLSFFVADVVIVPFCCHAENTLLPTPPVFSLVASRAPPAVDSVS